MTGIDPSRLPGTILEIECRLEIDTGLEISFFRTWVVDPILPVKSLPPLAPGRRRVHADGDTEREPRDFEPFTVVERRGNLEFVSTPVFRSRNGDDFTYHIVKPRLNGPWEVTDCSTPWYPLEDGREQGWWVLIRLAKGVRP